MNYNSNMYFYVNDKEELVPLSTLIYYQDDIYIGTRCDGILIPVTPSRCYRVEGGFKTFCKNLRDNINVRKPSFNTIPVTPIFKQNTTSLNKLAFVNNGYIYLEDGEGKYGINIIIDSGIFVEEDYMMVFDKMLNSYLITSDRKRKDNRAFDKGFTLSSMHKRILDVFEYTNRGGLTTANIASILGKQTYTISGRITELVHGGYLIAESKVFNPFNGTVTTIWKRTAKI